MSAGVIEIDDLSNPQLDAAQCAALEAAERQIPALTVESVLAAARARTGLGSFGEMEFVDRLEVWLKCIREDDGLSALGRLGAYEDCIRNAVNRQRIEALLQRHPEISDQPLESPLVIVGLPRSGTTNLVNLLGEDHRFRSMPLWEGMEPVPATDSGADERRERTRRIWAEFESLLPHMRSMHEMAPDHVHEDIELQMPDFGSYNLEWVCRAHDWQRWYFEHDRAPQYEYARRVLRILSWYKGPQRWLLKSPQHMENLPALARTYPDATVVITHRDPVAVIQSIVTMIAYGDRMRRRRINLPSLAAYWIDRIELLLRACVRDREALPASRSIDVPFHEYMADTDGLLQRIYALAGIERTPSVAERQRRYELDHPRGHLGQVRYHLVRDFGVDAAELRKRFDFYYRRFSVRIEAIEGESR